MSTLFQRYGFRFFYRMFDLTEPCHVHAGSGRKLCKYWIRADGTFVQEFAYYFTKSELKKIEKAIETNMAAIKASYEDDCKRAAITPNYYKK